MDITYDNELLEETNSILSKMSSQERIMWARQEFGDSIIMTTSGGETSAILPHLVNSVLSTRPPIIFVDTGYYSDATLKMIHYLRSQDYNVQIYTPELRRTEIEKRYPRWWTSDQFETVRTMIKHDPLNRAFSDHRPRIWLTGVMSYKTGKEPKMFDFNNGLYMLRPLLDWTEKKAMDYLSNHDLPLNQNHQDITKSSGDSCDCGIHNSCGLIAK